MGHRPPIHRVKSIPRLKAEPELKLCHASSEGAQRAPEVSGVREIGIATSAGLKGRKIENIEGIEEVGPDFQVCRLPEMKKTRQLRLLDETEID